MRVSKDVVEMAEAGENRLLELCPIELLEELFDDEHPPLGWEDGVRLVWTAIATRVSMLEALFCGLGSVEQGVEAIKRAAQLTYAAGYAAALQAAKEVK